MIRDLQNAESLRQGEDTGEGDTNPYWAVVELVEQLIKSFLEQVSVEQAMGLQGLWNEMRCGLSKCCEMSGCGQFRAGDGGAPGGEEFGGDGVLPELRPGF